MKKFTKAGAKFAAAAARRKPMLAQCTALGMAAAPI